jgi:hypothetical protein
MTLKPNATSCNLIVRPSPFSLLSFGWNVLTIFGKELGEDDNHETTKLSSGVVSDASRATADLAQPLASVSQAKGAVSISPRL